VTKLTKADLAEWAAHVSRDLEKNEGPVFGLAKYPVARGLMLACTDEGVRTITVTMPASIGKTRLL